FAEARPRVASRPAAAGALELEEALADSPAAVPGTDQVVLLGARVGEEGLAEGGRIVDQPDRTGQHARLAHIDQHEADALMLLGGVGAHQAEAPIGEVGARGPDLLAVDQIVVALVFAPGLQGSEVGAGARLRIALAP